MDLEFTISIGILTIKRHLAKQRGLDQILLEGFKKNKVLLILLGIKVGNRLT